MSNYTEEYGKIPKKSNKPKIRFTCIVLTLIAILVSVLLVLCTAKQVYAVYVAEDKVGYTQDTSVLDSLRKDFYAGIITESDEYHSGVAVTYKKEMRIFVEPKYLTNEEFTEALSDADENVSVGYRVFLNGKQIAILKKRDDGEKALRQVEDEIEAFVKKEYPDIKTVEFENEITVEQIVVWVDEICDCDKVVLLLSVGGDIASVPAYKSFDSVMKSHEKAVKRMQNEASAVSSLEKYLREYSTDDEIEYQSDEYYKWLTDFIYSDDYNDYLFSLKESLGLNFIEKSDVKSETDAEESDTDFFMNENMSSLLKYSAVFTEKIREKVERKTEKVEVEYRKVDYNRVTKAGSDGVDEVEYSVRICSDGETKTEISRKTILKSVNEELTVGTSEYTEAGVATGTMLWPIETIGMLVTSYFGEVRDDYDSDTSGHRGVDLCGYQNEPVYAVDGGTVIESGFTDSYGYHVKIDHGNGLVTNYAHLYKKEIKAGEKVYQGQIIGHVGSSGASSNYHLHFEVRKNGGLVDPIEYLYPIKVTYYFIP